MTERLQLIGFGMIYAGVCPVSTPLVVAYFFFDPMLMRACEKRFIQREVQKNSMTLGEGFITYLEILTGIVTITSTFLLFYVSRSFNNLIPALFGVTDPKQQLAVILLIEHLLLFFLLGVKAYIPDFPRFLLKRKDQIEILLGQMGVQTLDKSSRFKKTQKQTSQKPDSEIAGV